MYFLWFGIAILMFAIYSYIGFSVWVMAGKRVFTQEKVTLKGIERYYPIVSAAAIFLGISSLYFSVISFTGSPHFTCWLLPTITISLIEVISRQHTLKKLAPNE